MDSLFKAFTVFENEDGSFKSEIISKSIDDLPPGDVFYKFRAVQKGQGKC